MELRLWLQHNVSTNLKCISARYDYFLENILKCWLHFFFPFRLHNYRSVPFWRKKMWTKMVLSSTVVMVQRFQVASGCAPFVGWLEGTHTDGRHQTASHFSSAHSKKVPLWLQFTLHPDFCMKKHSQLIMAILIYMWSSLDMVKNAHSFFFGVRRSGHS